MSYETRYAAAVRQRADAYASTPEAASARAKLKEAFANAKADVAAKFVLPLRAEDVAGALDYQQERITFWRNELRA